MDCSYHNICLVDLCRYKSLGWICQPFNKSFSTPKSGLSTTDIMSSNRFQLSLEETTWSLGLSVWWGPKRFYLCQWGFFPISVWVTAPPCGGASYIRLGKHEHFQTVFFYKAWRKKSSIRETPTLSTDADSRTDTNLKRFHDLSFFYHGLLPERQSHGHGASCFFRSPLTGEMLRENRQEQTCLQSLQLE